MHCPMYYRFKKSASFHLYMYLTLVQTQRYFPKCISDAVVIFPFLIMIKYLFSDVPFIQLSVFNLLTFFIHTFSSKNDMLKCPE